MSTIFFFSICGTETELVGIVKYYLRKGIPFLKAKQKGLMMMMYVEKWIFHGDHYDHMENILSDRF